MGDQSFARTFPAELDSLRAMLGWMRDQLKECRCSDVEMRHIEVALEEALVNIIHYAYPDKRGSIEIRYRFFPDKHLELIIKDHGKPFNPMKNGKKIDRFAPLEERVEGGLGISFIHGLMDEVEYAREGGANILTLKKLLKKN